MLTFSKLFISVCKNYLESEAKQSLLGV